MDLKVRPPRIREYIDRLRTIVSDNGIRTLILLLGDNDFTFRNGALRPTYNDAIQDPSGVARRWVATAAALARDLGCEHVLLTMLHARIDWHRRGGEWRYILCSLIFLFCVIKFCLIHSK